MKLSELIIADVRREGVWEELHKWLFKIPPLKKYGPAGDVPLEALEKLMWLFDEKYSVRLQYIMSCPQPTKYGKVSYNYSCSLKDNVTNEWIDTVYGLSIYECYVKMVLLSYGYIRNKKS